ncbi:MAG TPA: Coq4 family protein [Polyangiaceae bacterium]|jgi:ubiquinone biosynthesis protein Coq4
MNLAKLLHAFRAYRAGAPLGDVAMLKLDAFAAVPAEVTAKLEGMCGYAPEQDVAALRALPAGSLGREYARFLDANGITPLAVSPAMRARFRDAPYALRYTATHDLHHVLAGFDTGLAGEAGVLAFNVGQGAAPVRPAMLGFVRVLYTLVSPTQAGAVANNLRVGRAMGEKAGLVIAAPLESWFDEPLAEVRAKLGIPPQPREAGVMASKGSVVTRLLMPRASVLRRGG